VARPDFRKLEVALAVALRAARTDEESRESMEDRLYTTAAEKDGHPYYRPYAAAASWLESDPDALQEGQRGVTFADRATVVASLRADQYQEDLRAGLIAQVATAQPFAGAAR
jgi:hypothetical protein